jgi:hypothetical protein
MLRTADKALQFGLPLGQVIRLYEPSALTSEGELTASSSGTALTLNGVGNTKPATWTQIVAATASDADGFFVHLQNADTGISDYLVDVGLGAASSEVTIVSNILTSSGNADGFPGQAYYPIPIPAGSRIAMRHQCTDTAGNGQRAVVTLVNGGLAAKIRARFATTYGADTTDSGGTAVDAGAGANTKNTWSQLTAATTSDIDSMVICVGQRNNAANSAQNILLDIGIGAAASETVVVPDIYYRASLGEEIMPKQLWVPVTVKAGQRLSARIQSSTTDATDRVIDVAVIGFTH